MKQFILKNKKAIAGMAACLLIGGVTMSFEDTPYVSQIMDARIGKDTVPDKFSGSAMKMTDFDKLTGSLDNSVICIDAMKDMDMNRQIEMTLEQVNIDAIMKELAASLSKIDIAGLVADVKFSLDDMEWKNKNGEIKEAIEAAKQELENSRAEFSNIDKAGIKKELQEARTELEEARQELNEINVQKIRQEAKVNIDEARLELQQTKALFRELDKDGLVNSKEGFTIEYKDSDLYINDIKQSQQVTGKYRKYINKNHFKIKIEKE